MAQAGRARKKQKQNQELNQWHRLEVIDSFESDTGWLRVWVQWTKTRMIDETIEVAGVDKPFMEFYFKWEQINSRQQVGDTETKLGNITVCSNANGDNNEERKFDW